MKEDKYFTAIKVDGKWQPADTRGYKDIDYCRFNAIELSKRNGGTEVGIVCGGAVLEVYYKGEIISGGDSHENQRMYCGL
ncbi:MAG TPA: hypothetical protein DCY12_06905 [Candidatus Atribacteria bacterium]|jgi:hypothetical protein|nr:hypothetical protein [Candidatus Atribacteria bacterium]